MRARLHVLCLAAACGNSQPVHHLADSGTDGHGSSSGSGTPEPCAVAVTSTAVSGSTGSGSGTCTATLVNQATIALQFVAANGGANSADGGFACTITPGVIPQSLGFRTGTLGCTIEIDEDSTLNGILDSWDGTASSTIDIQLTDLSPVSGTISLVLEDGSGIQMTVDGTF